MNSASAKEVRQERNPEATRGRILGAAFEEIHRKGFQGMRLDQVLTNTGLTKGALYHHFPNKKELGYAVVDDVIMGFMTQMWLEPLQQDGADPVATIERILGSLMQQPCAQEMIELGCPLNNLAQEMSPLDEGFRTRLDQVFQAWHGGLVAALNKGQNAGTVKGDIDTDRTATFLMASIEGCIGMAKNAQSTDRFAECSAGLLDYLKSLRA